MPLGKGRVRGIGQRSLFWHIVGGLLAMMMAANMHIGGHRTSSQEAQPFFVGSGMDFRYKSMVVTIHVCLRVL